MSATHRLVVHPKDEAKARTAAAIWNASEERLEVSVSTLLDPGVGIIIDLAKLQGEIQIVPGLTRDSFAPTVQGGWAFDIDSLPRNPNA